MVKVLKEADILPAHQGPVRHAKQENLSFMHPMGLKPALENEHYRE